MIGKLVNSLLLLALHWDSYYQLVFWSYQNKLRTDNIYHIK